LKKKEKKEAKEVDWREVRKLEDWKISR